MEIKSMNMDIEKKTEMLVATINRFILSKSTMNNEKQEEPQDRMDFKETAKFLNIGIKTLYSKSCLNQVPSKKQKGQRTYFSRKELTEWQDKNKKPDT